MRIAVCGCAAVSFAVPLKAKVIPYVNAKLLGGQYFFKGQSSSLSGNASVLASAAIDTKSDITYIPLYEGRYQGTKQVQDLVGGGTLFQELMEHRVACKALYEVLPGFTLKPEAGYEFSYLKETRDEKWGTGLFDYRRPSLALEGEYVYADPFSVRLVTDFYWLRYPNYTSLESQVGGSMARELVGADVINSFNKAVTAGANGEISAGYVWDAELGLTLRSFGDQHIINAAGQFEADTRHDNVWLMQAALRNPRRVNASLKLVSSLELAFVRTRSDQNDYDATNTFYTPGYYNNNVFSAGINFLAEQTLYSGSPLELRAGLTWNRTNYTGRFVQDAAGAYLSDKIYLNQWHFGAGAAYPIAPDFKWLASIDYIKQTSNMDYEKLYTYNYSAFTYMMGISYTWE